MKPEYCIHFKKWMGKLDHINLFWWNEARITCSLGEMKRERERERFGESRHRLAQSNVRRVDVESHHNDFSFCVLFLFTVIG